MIIDCWRGVLVHTFFILFQPIYLTTKLFVFPQYFKATSTTWLAIHAITWIYVVTKISVPFLLSPFRHVPSPPSSTFPLGNLDFNGGKPQAENILEKIKRTPNDGVLVLWSPFYLSYQILVTTSEALMEMLNTRSYDWEKPSASKKFLERTIGSGLVSAEGDAHKAMRRQVTPAFSGHHIKDLVPLFYSKGLQFVDSMARKAKAAPDHSLEMMGQMSRVTLDIIGSAGVGKDFDTIENDDDQLAKLYATITDTNKGIPVIFFWMQAFVPRWIVRLMKGSVYAQVAEAQIQLREQARALMQEKRLKMVEKSEQQNDIISIIMRSGDFSDDYLVNQLLTFLAAGHDTTASALTWATWLLAVNQDMQSRLRTECKAHLPNPHSTSTSSIDPSLFESTTTPYLTAVCNEVLRLYPTVPITVRVSARPTKLGIHSILPKTTALISMWSINRSETLWGADAAQFNPDRWIEGPNAANGGASTPYALLTFLHGPRSCIGKGFALTEMKCLLAVLVMRFRFEVAEPEKEVEIGGFVTIKPRGGLKLRIIDLLEEGEKEGIVS